MIAIYSNNHPDNEKVKTIVEEIENRGCLRKDWISIVTWHDGAHMPTVEAIWKSLGVR